MISNIFEKEVKLYIVFKIVYIFKIVFKLSHLCFHEKIINFYFNFVHRNLKNIYTRWLKFYFSDCLKNDLWIWWIYEF